MARKTEYKSSVFSMLLEDEKNCLEVYNALNGTAYDDPGEIIINKLENGIILTIRNDASFLIDAHFNLYEHQSTYNPNMPLRGLIYYVELLKEMVMGSDLYTRKLVKIPTPHFVVFYNGMEKRPEIEELYLSSAYTQHIDSPELEVKCTVYNINQGKNKSILDKCRVLSDYMIFVNKVRYFLGRKMGIDEALDIAIKECITNDVLSEFLQTRGDEVKQVAALDYTFERREKLFTQEAKEEGIEIGKKIGLSQGLSQGIGIFIKDKLDDGVDEKIILEKLKKLYDLSSEDAKKYLEECKFKYPRR